MKGSVIGTVAVAMALYAVALGVSVLADAGGWSSFDLGIGPLTLLTFERTSHETATTFGVGLGAICLLVGVLNGAAAVMIRRHDAAATAT
jgi:hypothetical protein